MTAKNAILATLSLAALATGGFFFISRVSGGVKPSGPAADPPRIDKITVTRVPERMIEGRSAGFEVIITGSGYYGTAFGPFVKLNGADAAAVIIDSPSRITALADPALKGAVEIEVMNPDHQAARATADFR